MASDIRPLLNHNRLLASLPPDTSERLAPHLQRTMLTYRETIFQPGDSLPDIYFPLNWVVSLVALAAEGTGLETALVGREGLTPLVVLLGVETATQQGLIQEGGDVGAHGALFRVRY